MTSSSLVSVLALSVAAAAIFCTYGPNLSELVAESTHEFHASESSLRADIIGLPKELAASKRQLTTVPKQIKAEMAMTAIDARTASRTTGAVLQEAPSRIAHLAPAQFFLAAALIFFAILLMRPRKKETEVGHHLFHGVFR